MREGKEVLAPSSPVSRSVSSFMPARMNAAIEQQKARRGDVLFAVAASLLLTVGLQWIRRECFRRLH